MTDHPTPSTDHEAGRESGPRGGGPDADRARDLEQETRDADAANGEPGALDTEPPDGSMPSDADVQAERQR